MSETKVDRTLATENNEATSPPVSPKSTNTPNASPHPRFVPAPEHFPAPMHQYRQWVCYAIRDRVDQAGKLKQDKIPLDPHTGHEASVSNPATWATLPEAIAALIQHPKWNGIGFVFTKDDPFTFIDMDNCIEESGQLKPIADAELKQLDSYSAYSQSGRGVHVIVYGDKPGSVCRNSSIDREMYSHGHFVALTGLHLPTTLYTIEERPSVVAALYAKWLAGDPVPTAPPADGPSPSASAAPAPPDGFPGSDAELLQRMFRCKCGSAIQALHGGQWQGHYPSQSEADLAFCSHLAFWTGGDATRMDSIFRTSGLFRPKWDEPHGEGGKTYGQMTIERALRTTRTYYTPSPPRGGVLPWVRQQEERLKRINLAECVPPTRHSKRGYRTFDRDLKVAAAILRLCAEQETVTPFATFELLRRMANLGNTSTVKLALLNLAGWFADYDGVQKRFVVGTLVGGDISVELIPTNVPTTVSRFAEWQDHDAFTRGYSRTARRRGWQGDIILASGPGRVLDGIKRRGKANNRRKGKALDSLLPPLPLVALRVMDELDISGPLTRAQLSHALHRKLHTIADVTRTLELYGLVTASRSGPNEPKNYALVEHAWEHTDALVRDMTTFKCGLERAERYAASIQRHCERQLVAVYAGRQPIDDPEFRRLEWRYWRAIEDRRALLRLIHEGIDEEEIMALIQAPRPILSASCRLTPQGSGLPLAHRPSPPAVDSSAAPGTDDDRQYRPCNHDGGEADDQRTDIPQP